MVGNHEFKRIRERVDNYVNKGWHSKVGSKSIIMAHLNFFYKI